MAKNPAKPPPKGPNKPRRRPEPTLIEHAGRRMTQLELTAAIAKETEALVDAVDDLTAFVGDSPYHMPPIGYGLSQALSALRSARGSIELILLCQEDKKTQAEKDEEWVDGLKDEFKKEWEKYKKEKGDKAESWETYWDWIKKFFLHRGILKKGWLQVMEEVLAKKKGDVRDKLDERLRELGKKIAKEWAKDNKTRKINSDHLKKWAAKLEKAAKADVCDGKAIGQALDEIEKEVDDLLK